MSGSRFERWYCELLELAERADTVEAQVRRTAGLVGCLPPDTGLRDALAADLHAITRTARMERDALLALLIEVYATAQQGRDKRKVFEPAAPRLLAVSC